MAVTKETDVAEFELQLFRLFSGFTRWTEECEKIANNTGLTANELSILHIIRMKNQPKSSLDIGKLLNRTDNFNISYTLKKLLKMGLIAKAKNTAKNSKSTLYIITESGIKNADNYSAIKTHILINKFYDEKTDLSEIAKIISQLKTIYEAAEQAAVLHNHCFPEKTTAVSSPRASTRKKIIC